jgi:hypothetical protein
MAPRSYNTETSFKEAKVVENYFQIEIPWIQF